MAYTFRNPVEQQLEGLHQQIQALQIRRQVLSNEIGNIDEQIRQLTAFLEAMQPIVAQSSVHTLEGMSLADLCRLALDAQQGNWITAHQVRAYLQQLGVIFQYNNVMAVLHNTLKRVGQTRPDAICGTVYARKD